MKKNYNPFKMWGSYVGALIGFYTGKLIGLYGVFYFLPIILGFLLGWAIQSLWRKFK